jgi:hypothetical protein
LSPKARAISGSVDPDAAKTAAIHCRPFTCRELLERHIGESFEEGRLRRKPLPMRRRPPERHLRHGPRRLLRVQHRRVPLPHGDRLTTPPRRRGAIRENARLRAMVLGA